MPNTRSRARRREQRAKLSRRNTTHRGNSSEVIRAGDLSSLFYFEDQLQKCYHSGERSSSGDSE
jgi:hypothetical protein